jgi:hypothetical protein
MIPIGRMKNSSKYITGKKTSLSIRLYSGFFIIYFLVGPLQSAILKRPSKKRWLQKLDDLNTAFVY